MGIVAVSGDVATTTAVALASGWPVSGDTVLVEADATGGDLAAWFDLPAAPSLSTVVTRVLDGAWPEIERHTRLADTGLRLIPAPARAAEAAQAVGEAARSLVASLAALRSPITIADVGGTPPTPTSHSFVAAASLHLLVHRQSTQSARAAAVRLQRLADQVELFVAAPVPLVVAVVGSTPYEIGEIDDLLRERAGPLPVVGLPDDPLAAAVLAGRTGVSARRLARLPLLRAARELAAVVERSMSGAGDTRWRTAR